MSDGKVKRVKIQALFAHPEIGTEIWVKGWVRTRRDSKGGFSFVEINDGSCFANMQAVLPASLPGYATLIAQLHTGSSIAVRGTLVASQGKNQSVEIQVLEAELLGAADPASYPIGKQKMSYEYLRDYTHLRARTNTFGAIARVRNVLARAVHDFFQQRGFIWVHTPILSANDCEGAGETFHVTTLPLDKIPMVNGQVDYAQDFFAAQTNLTVSGQLEAETYACAMGDVYTFGPTFRAENSHTSRHLAEFWMVEPEMAFADLNDDAELAESFLKFLLNAALTQCPREMEFFQERIEPNIIKTLQSVVSQDFKRLTYTEAITLLEPHSSEFKFPVSWGMDLQSEHERYLTETAFKCPVILTDYPKDIKAFYMKQNEDGKTVRAMDVLVPGIGEIIGGSQREDRLEFLQKRIEEMKLPVEELQWYLDLRRFGSVPHAGFGLGFERLVLFVTGMGNIRDVIPFPRTPGKIKVGG